MSDDRRSALRDRVAALSADARRTLADALARDGDAGGAAQLVAYVVLQTQEGAPAHAAPTEEQLRAFLAARLPAYMVPTRFAALERLPRTPAGKLDRHALAREAALVRPAPPARSVVAPRTPVEVTLAQIWKEVLRVDEVGVHDDFFEIGGDSLLSIRVIARAGRVGLKIPVDRFFDNPTIAQLAAVVDARADARASTALAERVGDEEQGPITGEAPLTPIQHWFLDAIGEHRDHWNQSYLLDVGLALDVDAVEACVRTLVAHHDALRLRLVQREGEWRQDFRPVATHVPLRVVDLAAQPAANVADRVAAECDREHASIRLGDGELFRCVLFVGAGGWRRLLLLAHHLVVDGVSWDVLLEDVAALLEAASRGEPLRLPPKTASAREWAVRLAAAAATPAVVESAPYWLGLAAGAPLPMDFDDAVRGNRSGDAALCTVALDETASTRLLGDVARRLDASPQALLLSAVLLAWPRWTGSRELLLDVEGHGRDALGDALDVSRTVGWFTTVFPVRLGDVGLPTTDSHPSPPEVVRAVHATLSALPQRGASHGMLRWLGPDEAVRRALGDRPRPEVLFNYLGVRGAPFPPGSPIRLAAEPQGRARSADGPRAYALEINARVDAGCLIFDIEYSRRLHRASAIERFADALRQALGEIAATQPSSFALAMVDAAALSRVADLLAEIDDE